MISILIPCLNEERYIENCLTSVLSFEEPLGHEIEVLVIDGGSADGTRELLEAFAANEPRVRLLDNPKRIQSCALNLGLRHSRGEWVMRLDAHTIYPPEYLRLCHATAVRTGADNTGGVWVTNPGDNRYEAQLVQALTTHRFGVGNSTFRTGALQGSRDTVPFGFFRREVFDRIGYFDERLVRTQDYEFNRRLRAAGGLIYLDPEIRSFYFNVPRLGSFLKKQFYLQGPYNSYMWYLAPYAFTPRHAITGAFALFFWGGLALSTVDPRCGVLFLSVMALYASVGLWAAGQQAHRYGFVRHIFCLPIGFFLFHLSHGTGVLMGLCRLACKIAPVQQIREPWPGAGKYRAWP